VTAPGQPGSAREACVPAARLPAMTRSLFPGDVSAVANGQLLCPAAEADGQVRAAAQQPSPAAAVREFHGALGYPVSESSCLPDEGLRDLRRMLLAEEAQGADEAVADTDVAYGTALTYRVGLDAVIAEVHRANVTKDRGTTGKAVKGDRFGPADVRAVVDRREDSQEQACAGLGLRYLPGETPLPGPDHVAGQDARS
jgi:predicted HAD superfamily Cof-like phosphohydrolase